MDKSRIKRIMFGEPFPNSQEHHERLDKVRGLAVFASDPISSNAYATEAVMSIIVVLGSGALSTMTLPIVMAIASLVLIVIFSYIQTIMHYPKGGGSYIVAKDNLGTLPSLIAAAALLTDYSLTVAVSVSAGIRAVASAFPAAYDYRVWLALGIIGLLTWMNLRGVRESGTVFAVPTYAFVGGVLLVIVIGLVRSFGLFGAAPLVAQPYPELPADSLTQLGLLWIVLRAFAAGCTALTGIEAISDGVQAFKAPEAKNAAKTMVTMGVMAMSLFVGISFLATHLHLVPMHHDSLLSQLTRTVVGDGVLYYWVQTFTMLILVLAANTGYQDFPRLSYFLARDKFMPRWMRNQGERLVFNGGILTLAVISSVVVLIFQADEFRMLPLYAIGVMISFTLSQSGMFRLMGKVAHLKPGESMDTSETHLHHEHGWQWKRALNALGASTTFIVFIILVVTKFMEGAWIIVLVIPLLIFMFYSIHRHYENVADNLSTKSLGEREISGVADVVIMPIGDVHRGTLRALQYANMVSQDVRAVYVSTDAEQEERFRERWSRFPNMVGKAKLIKIEHDYRDFLPPLIKYIEKVNCEEFPEESVTVMIPEVIITNFVTNILHNKTSYMLRRRLRRYLDIIIIEIPFHILDAEQREALAHGENSACDVDDAVDKDERPQKSAPPADEKPASAE